MKYQTEPKNWLHERGCGEKIRRQKSEMIIFAKIIILDIEY
jgi:hypothetical protein